MRGTKKATTSDEAPRTSARKRSPRRWLYRIIATVVVPALFFAGLEGTLRLFGYGYSTGFFVRDGDYYQSNPAFGRRFFPRAVSRAPLPLRLSAKKPEGVYRIFIIGGSAAQGFPDPNYSFSRFLVAMLRDRFPRQRFEVANAAMTAANSHVMVPVARDCAELEPDLFVVYLGNNEVVGPFGAGTVFGGHSSSLWEIRTSLWIKSTRVSQWVDSLVGGSGRGPAEWGGMAMFMENKVATDDPRLKTVYGHYRRNLEDICDAATSRGAKVLLCTVPVNLRHCAPFASVHKSGLSPSAASEWTSLYEQGVGHEAEGRPDQAAAAYMQVAGIDDDYADLHFRLGRCFLGLDQPDKAKEHFVRARELDALRFRADEGINGTIRHVAAGDEQVHLVDAERAFEVLEGVVAGAPGEELFFDHVHPTYRGNYEMAREVLAAVVEQLPEAIRGRDDVGAPSYERCCELLALTHWDRLRTAVDLWRLTAEPPFTGQLNYTDMRWRQLARREGLWATRTPIEEILAAYDLALAAAPDDAILRIGAATAYGKGGNYSAVALHLAEAKRLLPNEPKIYMVEAMMYLGQGNVTDAQRAVATHLELLDHSLPGYDAVISLFESRGYPEKAEAYARQAVTRMREQATALTMLAKIVSARRRLDPAERRHALTEAEHLLDRAVRLEPEHAGAWCALGNVQLATGRAGEAAASFRRAIELDPAKADGYVGLATVRFRQGQPAQAKANLAKAVELSPDDLPTTVKYAELLCIDGNVRSAAALLHRAARIGPGLAPVEAKLAWLLATSADPEVRDGPQAVRLAERAAAASRGRPQVMVSLAAAYAADGQFDQAVDAAEQALSGAEQMEDPELAGRIRGHLALYVGRKALSLNNFDRIEGW